MIKLREYQTKAILNLERNNWSGIFDMATGTGKTLTSLFASNIYLKEKSKICRLIIVPYLHLIEQWENECLKLGIKNIVKCSGAYYKWEEKIHKLIRNYNIGLINEITIITTYNSVSLEKFKNNFIRINNNIFLIADECHYFGTSRIDTNLFDIADAKLGLSATPQRWLDKTGSNKIMNFFRGIVFEYNIDNAIRNDFLVSYKYYYRLVDLTEEEIVKFKSYNHTIAILLNDKNIDEKLLLDYLIKRKKIIDNAELKIDLFKDDFSKLNVSELNSTLVYCTYKNIDEVTKFIGDLGFKVRKFNYQVNKDERLKILKDFEENEIQVLTAMKCLDEGVDIPSIKNAYFLSSSSNPREFVQRRGRILRCFPGKIFANIYDYLVFPVLDEKEIVEKILKIEMPRFAEFSSNAINGSIVRASMIKKLSYLNLEDLVYLNSWDIEEKYLIEGEDFEY